jgi:3'(2'), 5'-bisphosphate nucleotidase / inositol polyphosphate 1-phosphatase
MAGRHTSGHSHVTLQLQLLAGLPESRCLASSVAEVSAALFMESYDSRHSNHSTTSRIAAELSIQKPPLQLDSQCKYGLLARGDAELFMRFPHASYR